MASAVEQRVKEIICEQLGVSEDQVTAQASFIVDIDIAKLSARVLGQELPRDHV